MAKELKFFDLTTTNTNIPITGNIIDSFNEIAQGFGESERVGRKCTIKSVQCRARMSIPANDAGTFTLTGDTVRWIIYIDKQTNGAAAGITQVLVDDSWLAWYNLANTDRFIIMHDKTYTMNYTGCGGNTLDKVNQAKFIKDVTFEANCNVPIEFEDTSGLIGTIQSNNIGYLLISSAGRSTFAARTRIRFTD